MSQCRPGLTARYAPVIAAAMAMASVCGAQAPATPAPVGATPAVTAAAAAAASASAKAAWTLMVYLDADNNLEQPMMRNLEEMATVGSSADVNIVALVARSPKGEEEKGYTKAGVLNLKDWSTAKLLKVEKGRLTELEDWGAANMSLGETLKKFLATATQKFPAQRYGFILGDHGSAWAGVAVSESQGPNQELGLVEINDALKETTAASGRLELVGFDACLMANLEVAKTFAPFARYLVASEEIEPAEGWDYRTVLDQLEANPAMDGKELGRSIVDSYHAFFGASKQPDAKKQEELRNKAKGITLSLVDLSKIPAVEQAVVAMSGSTDSLLEKGGHDAFVRIADARRDAEEYGRSSKTRDSEVYDLSDVARHVKERAQDAPSAAAANGVMAAVAQAVIYEKHGVGRPYATGLSIFYPPNPETLSERHKIRYSQTGFALSNKWYPFLERYTNFLSSPGELDRPKPAIDPLQVEGRMGGADGKVNIVSQAHGDEIEKASFVVALRQGRDRLIIGSIPVDLDPAHDLKEEWDGGWFTIADQNVEMIAPITSFEALGEGKEGDAYWAEIPAQVRPTGTKQWLDVTLTFLLDFRGEEVSGDFIYAVEYSDYGPREIDLDGGVDLRPVYALIDAAGEEQLTTSPDPAHVMHVDDVEDLKVEHKRMPAGDYQIGFVVEDLLGRDSESFVDIALPEEETTEEAKP